MKKDRIQKLKSSFNFVVDQYLNAFAEKYELQYEYHVEPFGSVFIFSEMFFDFLDMKFCIDNDVKENHLRGWYYLTIDEKVNINLPSYVRIRTDHEYKKGFAFKEEIFHESVKNKQF